MYAKFCSSTGEPRDTVKKIKPMPNWLLVLVTALSRTVQTGNPIKSLPWAHTKELCCLRFIQLPLKYPIAPLNPKKYCTSAQSVSFLHVLTVTLTLWKLDNCLWQSYEEAQRDYLSLLLLCLAEWRKGQGERAITTKLQSRWASYKMLQRHKIHQSKKGLTHICTWWFLVSQDIILVKEKNLWTCCNCDSCTDYISNTSSEC